MTSTSKADKACVNAGRYQPRTSYLEGRKAACGAVCDIAADIAFKLLTLPGFRFALARQPISPKVRLVCKRNSSVRDWPRLQNLG